MKFLGYHWQFLSVERAQQTRRAFFIYISLSLSHFFRLILFSSRMLGTIKNIAATKM